MNTGKAHGSALGADEVAEVKKILGFDPEQTLRGRRRGARARPQGRRPRPGGPRGVADDLRRLGRPRAGAQGAARPAARPRPAGRLGEGAARAGSPTRKGVATRKASGEVLNALADVLPELWGGSADLAESNNTTMEGADSFGPDVHRHQDVEGQPVRPHAALRGPRARDGRDPQRHRAARPDPPVRRHVPGVQRLHAPGGAARRADEVRGRLRLDARLDRPRRGRPDPPADRAPRRAARHPGPGGGPPRRRQRDRARLAGGAGAPGGPDGPRADPAEPAGAGGHLGRGRRPRRLRAGRGLVRRARR